MDRETVDEIKRHFGVVVEGLQSKIEAVAEGQQLLAEEMRAGFLDVRKELHQELQETRSMIRLSYVEVDRRLKDLEAGR